MFFHSPLPTPSSPSNPDNKVPLNLAYHRANIRRLRLRPDIFFVVVVGVPSSVDPIIGCCERVLRNKRTVEMSCTELVCAIYVYGAFVYSQINRQRYISPVFDLSSITFFVKLFEFYFLREVRNFQFIY